MASADKMLYGGVQVTNVARDSKTNATATATQAAPSAGQCLLIIGYKITASAAPAAAVQATLRYGTGPTTIETIQIPAAAFAPIISNFATHPIVVPEASKVDLVVPALGAGVVCDIVLYTIGSPI